ncbi:SMP-30/gluconolactonase/LRE family protein [Streptomyces sp. NBC_00963]|uniref:SMP-30/gluconolactonase/LRE family protein n=1 Tax=unclassified Streptomyces TaxID=2593676 RepID=UPI002259FEC2|nr:SMP-30/gluconolactonase/LRE family protein [Streptomyces sp. NBC_01306]MCX4726792.1 SMP-30/gluconolactonase/LRE family protein [Streptomyces sp. NBC_01306]WSX41957.1 SMP-30/gluconolactonase/LRE family protein [Streptomyces sp. NBC_00963]
MNRPDVAVRERAALGEGPTWDAAAGRLIWVDILSARVHTYDPATGRRTVQVTEQHVGAAKPRAGGGLVVNLRDGVGLYAPGGGAFSWLVHDPVPGRRANDAAVAPDGALWAGTMRYAEGDPGGGTLSRIAPDGAVSGTLAVGVSNGTGWSPDGSLMYYVDTPTRRIDVFDFDGELPHNRRVFATVEPGAGFPDGLTVDADGCVWVALWDGAAVRRYTPAGALDRTVALAVQRPTACAFGGRELRDLYISTARGGLTAPHPLSGSLLVVPGAGQGLPQPPFAG